MGSGRGRASAGSPATSLDGLWQACIQANGWSGFSLPVDHADVGHGTSIEVEPGMFFYRSRVVAQCALSYSVTLPLGLHVAVSAAGSAATRLAGDPWQRIDPGGWTCLRLGSDDERRARTRVAPQRSVASFGVSVAPEQSGQWRSQAVRDAVDAPRGGRGGPLEVRPGLVGTAQLLAAYAWQSPLAGSSRALHLQSQAYRFLDLSLARFDAAAVGAERVDPRCGRQLLHARDVLDARLSDAPPLAELARMVGLNPRRLSEGFRTVFGLSIPRYLAERRLEHARELLQAGARVSTVASVVGYTPEYFAGAFRRRFGMTPSQSGASG